MFLYLRDEKVIFSERNQMFAVDVLLSMTQGNFICLVWDKLSESYVSAACEQ
jgi:hypothetical protein